MAQARCSRGHIYDPEIYGDSCPYCASVSTSINFETTEDYSTPAADVAKSVPVSAIVPEDIPKTAPTSEFKQKQEEIGKTQSVFQPKTGKDPVVGWLVCVQGHDTGEDYKLRAKTNTIGRGTDNDVRIKGDDTITSATHAKIDYDMLNNDFYLLPGNNRNTIYLNGAPVYSAVKLAGYDRIRFGQSEVLFVPFCTDKFVWPTVEAKEE